MFSLISSSIRSAPLRQCFGLLFAVLVAASYKAHSEEVSFSHELDIFTIQPARSSTDQLPSYRIDLNLALTNVANAASVILEFGNTPHLHAVADPTTDTIWPTDGHWKIAPDNASNTLQALLRYESKDDRFVIKPRRHSLMFEWRKAF